MIIRGQSINAIREKCRHWTRLAADEHYSSSPRFLINIPKCDHHFSYTTIRAPANLWQLNEILGKERVSLSRILLQSKAFFNLMIFQKKDRQVNFEMLCILPFSFFFTMFKNYSKCRILQHWKRSCLDWKVSWCYVRRNLRRILFHWLINICTSSHAVCRWIISSLSQSSHPWPRSTISKAIIERRHSET